MSIEQIVVPEDILVANQEFSYHELQAMCLDGIVEHYISNVYLVYGYTDSPHLRAQILMATLPHHIHQRCCVAWMSSMWVYGLISAPAFIDIITRPYQRISISHKQEFMRVHEVKLEPEDYLTMGNILVTTPERTAFDIALNVQEEYAIRYLYLLRAITNFDLVIAKLHQLEKFPKKKLALQRITSIQNRYPTPAHSIPQTHLQEFLR